MNEYYITFAKLPRTVKGAIVPNPDGSYQIYLNQNLADNKKISTIQHEMEHGDMNHFYDIRSAAEIEKLMS